MGAKQCENNIEPFPNWWAAIFASVRSLLLSYLLGNAAKLPKLSASVAPDSDWCIWSAVTVRYVELFIPVEAVGGTFPRSVFWHFSFCNKSLIRHLIVGFVLFKCQLVFKSLLQTFQLHFSLRLLDQKKQPKKRKHWQLSQTQETHWLGKVLLSSRLAVLGRVGVGIMGAAVSRPLWGVHAPPAVRSQPTAEPAQVRQSWNVHLSERWPFSPHTHPHTSICYHYVLLPPAVDPQLQRPSGQCVGGGCNVVGGSLLLRRLQQSIASHQSPQGPPEGPHMANISGDVFLHGEGACWELMREEGLKDRDGCRGGVVVDSLSAASGVGDVCGARWLRWRQNSDLTAVCDVLLHEDTLVFLSRLEHGGPPQRWRFTESI